MKYRFLTTVAGAAVLLVSATVPAQAVPDKEVARCAAIDKDLERLDCYDGLAAGAGLDGPEVESSAPAGEWNVRSETSKIDDSTNVYLSVLGSETRGRYGRNNTPSLLIRCKENTTSLYVSWDQFITTESPRVTWRIDDQKARTTRWSISTDYEATGKWSGGVSIPFLKKLFGHDELLMQVTPHGESPVTTSFPVAGLQEAIKPLREACNW